MNDRDENSIGGTPNTPSRIEGRERENLMSIGMSDELASFDQGAVIKVCGVGGGGNNAVGRMIREGLQDVEFIAINTDAQALRDSPAGIRLQIGADVTGGLGSGAQPTVGQKAALEDRDRITDVLKSADMVFVTAGMGGGTGTGAAPIVAETARASGALTVGIVTLPFGFEGNERMDNAMKGLEELEERVDTLIVVPNDRVARLCQNNISLLDAFKQADEVLHNGVRAISELITVPGLINLDFADVRTIMQSRGRALMGIGVAEGEERAQRAAEEAIVCPLLEQSNIHGATGVIANIRGGCDIGMWEIQDAVSAVQAAADPSANIIFGAVVDSEERADVQVTVIAAGFKSAVREEDGSGQGDAAAPIEVVSSPDIVPGPLDELPSTEEVDPAAAKSEDSGVEREGVSAPAAVQTSPPEPEVEYLFPQDDSGLFGPVAKVEPDEDMSIPAFMRRGKRR